MRDADAGCGCGMRMRDADAGCGMRDTGCGMHDANDQSSVLNRSLIWMAGHDHLRKFYLLSVNIALWPS